MYLVNVMTVKCVLQNFIVGHIFIFLDGIELDLAQRNVAF